MEKGDSFQQSAIVTLNITACESSHCIHLVFCGARMRESLHLVTLASIPQRGNRY